MTDMTENDSRPIGIFDSGLGGLTVLQAVHTLMPRENIVYFGDSGRAPYGTKSSETVLKYTFQDMNFLCGKNVKMIVIACNTAGACSLETVSRVYSLPIVDVVGAGAEAAVNATRTGAIGIIGTTATVLSGVYERAIKRRLPDARFFAKACPLFVPLVEEGWWNHAVTRLVAEEYLAELRKNKIDTLVLGCTHYPYLQEVIGSVMGENVTLINSASAVAVRVKHVLEAHGLCADAEGGEGFVKYYTSDSVEKFKYLGGIFLGGQMEHAERVAIDREYDSKACNVKEYGL